MVMLSSLSMFPVGFLPDSLIPGVVRSVFVMISALVCVVVRDRDAGAECGLVVADEVGEEFRRLGGARVGGGGMNAVRSFVEAFSGFVDGERLAFHLRANRSLHHVAHDG